MRSVSSPVVLVPAYGRKYTTSEAMLKDWTGGKDFQVAGGPYTSIRDLPYLVDTSSSVWLAYGNLNVRVG